MALLEDRVREVGLDQLWLGRAAAMAERKALELPLAQASQSISVWDRLVFFHHTPDEADEKRLKDRIDSLDKATEQATAQIALAWADIEQDFPAVARARHLEAALAQAVWARDEGHRKAACQACQALVKQALGNLSESAVADLDPQQAVSKLFSQPGSAHIPALAALSALLDLSGGVVEATWQGVRPTLAFRPAVLVLAQKVLHDFKVDNAGIPLPVELAMGWMKDSGTPVVAPPFPATLSAAYPQGCSSEAMDRFLSKLSRLAGYDLCLTLLRGEISLLSRIAFWTDTPAEAREKRLKVERELLVDEIKATWSQQLRDAGERRATVWSAYVSDQTLMIRDAIGEIRTKSGDSSWPMSCPLLNLEPAQYATQAMSEHLQRTFGLRWRRADLLEAAIKTPRSDRWPAVAEHGFVQASDVVDMVGMMMERLGLLEKFEEMRSAQSEARQHRGALQDASASVSFWDRVNVFSESEAEKLARERSQSLDSAQSRSRYLADAFHGDFDAGLRQEHPPLLGCLLVRELEHMLSFVSAESASRTERYTSNGESKTRTVHYCVIKGMDTVRDALDRLARAAAPAEGEMLSPLAAWELRALLDCDQRGHVTALLGPGGL